MKDFSYYTDIKVSFPDRRDYTTYFVYKQGKVIGKFPHSEYGTVEELKSEGATVEKVFDDTGYREARRNYAQEERRLMDEFKKDLLEDLGITDHPKAEKLFTMAWDMGHSSGFHEIYQKAEELAELLY